MPGGGLLAELAGEKDEIHEVHSTVAVQIQHRIVAGGTARPSVPSGKQEEVTEPHSTIAVEIRRTPIQLRARARRRGGPEVQYQFIASARQVDYRRIPGRIDEGAPVREGGLEVRDVPVRCR